MTRTPKHLRTLVWQKYNGNVWEAKCWVSWCNNKYTCMSSNWHVGHNKPASTGGGTNIYNLRPICCDCNLGMGNRLTIDEWDSFYKNPSQEFIIANILLDFKDYISPKRKRSYDDTFNTRPSKKIKT